MELSSISARALSHAGKPFQYYGNDRIRSPEELVAVAERAGLVMTTYGVVTRDGPDIMKVGRPVPFLLN